MKELLVIGAGTLGSFLAASITAGGGKVALVAREPRFSEIRKRGVVLARNGATSRFEIDVRENLAGCEGAALALLCTKAQDLPGALALLKPLAGRDLGILTLQNGVDAPEIAARACPEAGVIAARVHGFFEMQEGVVRHVGVEPSIAFGRFAGPASGVEELLASRLAQAGIAFSRSPDIRRELWEKFLLASSLGGVGAALGIPAGRIREDAAAWTMLRDTMLEIERLALLKGVALVDDCVERTLAFAATFPPDATTSLQRDLEEGRPSEYDFLTGAAVRMAAESALDLPIHRTIAQRIAKRGLI
ncbi:MAG: ketopantoate reductase family protein [Novosphingobium sp.]